MRQTIRINETFMIPLKWLLVVIFVWPGSVAGALWAGSSWVETKIDTAIVNQEKLTAQQFAAIKDSINNLDKKLDAMLNLIIEEIRNGNSDP